MTESLHAALLPDRSFVNISGSDRIKYLHGLSTNDIRRLAPAARPGAPSHFMRLYTRLIGKLRNKLARHAE